MCSIYVEEAPSESALAGGRPHTYWRHQSSLREKAKIWNAPKNNQIIAFFILLFVNSEFLPKLNAHHITVVKKGLFKKSIF